MWGRGQLAGAVGHGVWGGEHGEPLGQGWAGGGRELAVGLGRVRVCWYCSERGGRREERRREGGGRERGR